MTANTIKNMPIYNAHNFNVSKIADQGNASRPALASVFFTRDKTVATDSYCLLEVSTPKADVKEFPKVLGKTAMRGAKPFLVDARQLQEIKLKSDSGFSALPDIVNGKTAIAHLDEQKAEFIWLDKLGEHTQTIARVNEQFPYYEKIFPKGKPQAEVIINAKLLADLLKVMAGLNEQVKIKIYGPTLPVQLECDTPQQKMRALIMPIKT